MVPSSPQASPSNTARLRHIRELDGIRGIAVLMVFFHHAAFSTLPYTGWTGAAGWLFRLASGANSGVDLFFVLSGFLITSLLQQDRRSAHFYRDFYWKRALRILPLYVIMLVFTLVTTHNWVFVGFCALFLANFASVFHVASTGPFWTLAIEEQFYLIWPTVVRKREPQAILRWAVFIATFSVAARLVFAWFDHRNYYLTFLHCDGLAFGAILACFFGQNAPGIEGRGRAAWALIGTLLLGWAGFFGVSRLYAIHAPWAYALSLQQTAIVLLTGSVVGLVILYSGSWWLGWLRSRVLVFFGLISYAFYMIHTSVIAAYDRFWGVPGDGDSRAFFIRIAVAATGTITLSLVSRYLVELPAISLRKLVLTHPSPRAEVQHPPLPLASM